MSDTYYNEPGVTALNRALFGFAVLQRGPRPCRRAAQARGGRRPRSATGGSATSRSSRRKDRRGETVTYVANIYKYYLAYQMMAQQRDAREQARTDARTASAPPDGG